MQFSYSRTDPIHSMRFWDQYRRGGKKVNQLVRNQDFLSALREALEAVQRTGTAVQKYTKREIDAMIELAEKEQKGWGYHDGPGGLKPDVPHSMNLE